MNIYIMKTFRNLLLFGFIFSTFALGAQPSESEREAMKAKIDSKRIAYLSEKLDLSPAEAQAFWPVYNQYRREIDEVQIELMKIRRKMRRDDLENKTFSDTELEKMLQTGFKNQELSLKIRQKYHERFKEVLSIQKVAILYKSEFEFHEILMKRMRKGGGDGKRGPEPDDRR